MSAELVLGIVTLAFCTIPLLGWIFLGTSKHVLRWLEKDYLVRRTETRRNPFIPIHNHFLRIAIDIRPGLRQPFGVGRYVRELVEHLADVDRQIEYVLLSASRKDALPAWVEDVVRAHDTVSALHLRLSQRALAWMSLYREMDSLEKLVGPVDVFHSNYLYVRPHGAMAVTNIHDVSFLIHPEFRRRLDPHEASVRRHARKADQIVTISRRSKEDIADAVGIDRSRIAVTYLAANQEVFRKRDETSVRRTLESLGLHHVKPLSYFIYAGDMSLRKNLRRLLMAFQRVRVRHPGTYLVLSGISAKDLAGYDPVGTRCPEIVPIGYVNEEQLSALYSGAHGLVYPSMYEGFGLPILEAMSCEVPVITSRCTGKMGGALEEISGGAAVLVDPTDETSIARGMEELLESPERRRELGDLGLQNASRFSWRRTAEETVGLYRSVSSGKGNLART